MTYHVKKNKFHKAELEAVKDPNDLRGHNQPPVVPGENVPSFKDNDKYTQEYFDNMPIGAIMKKRIKDTGKFSGEELRNGHVFPTLTGPQKEKLARMLLDGRDYLKYRDLRIACRMTIPLVDVRMIKSASTHFFALARELRMIGRDVTKSKFERVIKAQEAIVNKNGMIKFDHGLFEMLGIHSLR